VRILFGIALGVVLAVDRSPFLGDLAGGEPQPETEKMTRDRVQLQRAVRLVAVQVDRDADDRDVGTARVYEKYLLTGQLTMLPSSETGRRETRYLTNPLRPMNFVLRHFLQRVSQRIFYAIHVARII
jgi:hypothetical protein